MSLSVPSVSSPPDTGPLVDADASVDAEFLTFRLGEEEYAIEILKVQEIRGYEPPTRIANAPSFVKGVANLRGVIVPIVDLRLKFGLPSTCDALTVTVILNVADRVVGAVVDAVSDVVELHGDRVRPVPHFNRHIDAGYITGIGLVAQGERQRTLILIDIERLMASAEMGLVEPTCQ
jgi:purine-binding chemotaxis protein CheW